jgi:hypothetical protein
MISGRVLVVAVVTATALAGCGRLGLSDGPSRRPLPPPQQKWEPLPAAPAGTVTQESLQPLPPPAGAPPAGAPAAALPPPTDPNAPPAGQLAAPPPSVGAAKPTQVAEATPEKGMSIERGDFSGGWSLVTATDHCQLFASITTWAGGYRASSRGCTSPELQKISAWNVTDNRIVLKGSDGSTVATLTKSAKEKFGGQTSARMPISVTR